MNDILFSSKDSLIYSSKSNPKEALKGLIVLYAILNMPYDEFYQMQCSDGIVNVHSLVKCGWMEAFKHSQAAYKGNLKLVNMQKEQVTPKKLYKAIAPYSDLETTILKCFEKFSTDFEED